jgi:subtilisin family serine protease
MASLRMVISLVLVLFSVAQGYAPATVRHPLENVRTVVPGQYIIEFDRNFLVARDGMSPVVSLVQDMTSLGYQAKIKDDYSAISSRFSGATIEITNESNATIDEIKSLRGVKGVWNVETITLGKDIHDIGDPSPRWDPHVATRVAELHKRGLKGKGQRVCIIDTGIDANHPALRGKVAGGKNIHDPGNATNLVDCEGHGTFTSSLVVGANKDFSGVAPDAEILMYKVFGCDDTTQNSIVIRGILTADADGCEIISCSFGVDEGYSGHIMSRIANEVAEDKLLVASIGNTGEFGPFSAGTPAAGAHVLSVGSVNALQTLGWPATLKSSTGDTFNLTYVTPDGQKLNESVTAPVTFDSADACNPTQRGKVGDAVVIQRGICDTGKMYMYMADMGYSYYIMFDSYEQGVAYMKELDIRNSRIRLFAVTDASVGEWAGKKVANGASLTLQIEADANTSSFEAKLPSSGQMSYFSSWGPTFENDFIPSISGPGGLVYGAYPSNKYGVASGTSFSAPYVAGIAALFYAHMKKDSAEFARRISATAVSLPSYDHQRQSTRGDSVAPLVQQGSGLVDAVRLFDYKTILLSEPRIALNDTDNRVKTHIIRLQNTGNGTVVYKIRHVAADSIEACDDEMNPTSYFPPILPGLYGSLEAPETLSIGPGAVGEAKVTLNAPLVQNASQAAIWSGKVVFEGNNGEVISVPYMGIEVSTYNWTAIPSAPEALVYEQGRLWPVRLYTRAFRPERFDSPEIYFSLRYGTPEFSIDVVGEDWSLDHFSYPLHATSGPTSWYGPIRSSPTATFGGIMIFPMSHPRRFSDRSYVGFQSFANGTAIPSGRYRILTRSLRMFGDPTKAADWQLYLSDSFAVQHRNDPVPSAKPSTTSTTSGPTTPTATTDSVTSSMVETASPSSMPETTRSLSAYAKPTGLSAVVSNINMHSVYSDDPSIISDPGDLMELAFDVSIKSRIQTGTTVAVALPPEIALIPGGEIVVKDSAANLVANTTFSPETGLFSIVFTQWVEWHSNMTGKFLFSFRFTEAFQKKIVAGAYDLEVATVGKSYWPTIHYQAVSRDKIFEHSNALSISNTPSYMFDIEIPGSMGQWEEAAIQSNMNNFDDGLVCAHIAVFVSTKLDSSNRVIESRNVTNESMQQCNLKNLELAYRGSVKPDEVLLFRIGAIQGIRDSLSVSVPYSLRLGLRNGTSVTMAERLVTYHKASRMFTNTIFRGQVDRDGLIGG